MLHYGPLHNDNNEIWYLTTLLKQRLKQLVSHRMTTNEWITKITCWLELWNPLATKNEGGDDGGSGWAAARRWLPAK